MEVCRLPYDPGPAHGPTTSFTIYKRTMSGSISAATARYMPKKRMVANVEKTFERTRQQCKDKRAFAEDLARQHAKTREEADTGNTETGNIREELKARIQDAKNVYDSSVGKATKELEVQLKLFR